MPEAPENEHIRPNSIWATARQHPGMTTILVVCTATGAVLGALYLTPEWSLIRRVAAGALAGGGAAFIALATRVIG